MNIWKSCMWTADKNVNMKAIFAVMKTTWALVKIRPEINSGLYRIWTHDLWDTGADYSSLHGFIWNQRNDQLPVGMLAQSIEHFTGITEVIGSNPIQAWVAFRPYFHYCSSSVHYCKDCFHIHVFIYCYLVQGQRLMCWLYIDWKEIQLLENAWRIFCLLLQCFLCF